MQTGTINIKVVSIKIFNLNNVCDILGRFTLNLNVQVHTENELNLVTTIFSSY